MRRQADAHELLDGRLDRRVLSANLRDLERVNRWLGGAALSWRALAPFLEEQPRRPLRVLDVGTGAADIPRDMLRRAARSGARLEILAVDVQPEIVGLARQAAREMPGLSVELAASDTLPYAARSFDVAHASLVLHHLEPAAARAALAEMARVARRAVIINDLERDRLWFLGAWALSRVATRNAYTRHDAPLSVRRAYSQAEVVELARTAGLSLISHHHTRPPYRYALVFAHAAARP